MRGRGKAARLPGEDRLEIRRRVIAGETFEQAALAIGCSKKSIQRLLVKTGGVAPRVRPRSPLCLSLQEREEVSRGAQAGEPMRAIARRLGRSASTVLRDVAATGGRKGRAVAGHWEGDLVIGKAGKPAVGTLLERHSRYVMLLELPHGRTAERVREALTEQIQLRQYFPKAVDLSTLSGKQLDAIAHELNGRPRQTLAWQTPAEVFASAVATSPEVMKGVLS